jgi:hypothetical protein
VIQLSLRHKTDDQFWFSFFHEAAHLLKRRRVDFIDAAESNVTNKAWDEDDADRTARDCLIPPEDYSNFVSLGIFTAESVSAFAKDQTIAPGIVVGRLQRERLLDRSHLNSLKKPIHWGS